MSDDRNPRAAAPETDDERKEAENRLGQCLVAFGMGAGQIRVTRSAIRYLIDLYYPPFLVMVQQSAGSWHHDGVGVCDLARMMGRIAAHLALDDGRYFISDADAESAANIVNGSSGRAMEAGPRNFEILGRYCTFTAAEGR
jgi:hypothetical protein